MRRLLEECTKVLLDFEKDHPVELVAFGDLDVWPLMRLTFYHALIKDPGLEAKKEGKNAGRKVPLGKIASELDAFVAQAAETISSGSEVYFVQSTKIIQGRGGGPYHRFFDSLIELSDSRDSARFLYWDDGHSNVAIESLRSPSISYQDLGRLVRRWARSDDPIIESLCLNETAVRLVEEWNGTIPDSAISIESFQWDCLLLYKLAEVFEKVLAQNCSAVFATCFYSIPVFALSAACRHLGIPLIELQHGQQGDWHPMYTHWAANAVSRPAILPTHFWMWGRDYAARLQKWWPEGEFEIRCGGNPWLTLRSEEISGRILGPESKTKKVVLVSMQFLEIDKIVMDCAKNRDDIEWWFRLHPRMSDKIDAVSDTCRRELGPDAAWKVEEPTKADFYLLLQSVDVHLTGWSTTAYEAACFGKPTVLTHPNGKAAMAKDIESGLFGYAATAEELSQEIDSAAVPEDVVSRFFEPKESLLAEFESFRTIAT